MSEDLDSLRRRLVELERRVALTPRPDPGPGTPPPVPGPGPRPGPDPANGSEFRKALTRLSSDPDYRAKATSNPGLVTSDFRLSLKELQALRQVAVMSGADITQVNELRVRSIASFVDVGRQPDFGLAADVDVSCCSCCCCCCGETALEAS